MIALHSALQNYRDSRSPTKTNVQHIDLIGCFLELHDSVHILCNIHKRSEDLYMLHNEGLGILYASTLPSSMQHSQYKGQLSQPQN